MGFNIVRCASRVTAGRSGGLVHRGGNRNRGEIDPSSKQRVQRREDASAIIADRGILSSLSVLQFGCCWRKQALCAKRRFQSPRWGCVLFANQEQEQASENPCSCNRVLVLCDGMCEDNNNIFPNARISKFAHRRGKQFSPPDMGSSQSSPPARRWPQLKAALTVGDAKRFMDEVDSCIIGGIVFDGMWQRHARRRHQRGCEDAEDGMGGSGDASDDSNSDAQDDEPDPPEWLLTALVKKCDKAVALLTAALVESAAVQNPAARLLVVGGILKLYGEFVYKMNRELMYDCLPDSLSPPSGAVAAAAWSTLQTAADDFAKSVASKTDEEIDNFKEIRRIARAFVDATQNRSDSFHPCVLICGPMECTVKRMDPDTGEEREEKEVIPGCWPGLSTQPSLERLLQKFFATSGRDADFEIGASKNLFQKSEKSFFLHDVGQFIKELTFDDAYKYAKKGGKFHRKLESIVDNGRYSSFFRYVLTGGRDRAAGFYGSSLLFHEQIWPQCLYMLVS